MNPTEPATTLNPCRKCGSDAVVHVQHGIPGVGADEVICCCGTCTQRGEWKLTEAEAIASWNTMNFKKA